MGFHEFWATWSKNERWAKQITNMREAGSRITKMGSWLQSWEYEWASDYDWAYDLASYGLGQESKKIEMKD